MKYTIEDTTLIAIADSIRAKTGGADGIMPEDMPTEIEGIETGGGTEEIENIIDNSGVLDSTEGTATEKVERLINKAEEQDLWYEWSENYAVVNVAPQMFNGYQGTKLPRFNFSKLINTSRLLYQVDNVIDIDFYINCESSTNGQAMFYGTTGLKRMKGFNSSKMTNIAQCFMQSGIEEIEQPFDFSNITNNTNWLSGCNALKKSVLLKKQSRCQFLLQAHRY